MDICEHINFDNLNKIWQDKEYLNTIYEFKNPKSFYLETHFKLWKKQKNQKDYCVKILLEGKHIPVCEEINKELAKTYYRKTLYDRKKSYSKNFTWSIFI